MSAAAAAAAEAPAPAKKKGGALKLILVVLLTAGTAGGGAFYAARTLLPGAAPTAGDAAAGEEAVAGEEGGEGKSLAGGEYFSLDPSFVVNLNDPLNSRFLQLQAEVMALKPASLEVVRANLPAIRNRLLMLFSSQKYEDLLSREGKEKLQQQALDEVNKVLAERGKARVDAVVFTSFVMQ